MLKLLTYFLIELNNLKELYNTTFKILFILIL